MTRIISFADGFTSGSTPTLSGPSVEEYVIANNQASAVSFSTAFTIDGSDYKSAFVNFELFREDVSNEYLQAGSFILSYDGTNWALEFGSFDGAEIVSDALTNAYNVILQVSTSVGVGEIKYRSGNMGSSYVGTLKLSITRIAI